MLINNENRYEIASSISLTKFWMIWGTLCETIKESVVSIRKSKVREGMSSLQVGGRYNQVCLHSAQTDWHYTRHFSYEFSTNFKDLNYFMFSWSPKCDYIQIWNYLKSKFNKWSLSESINLSNLSYFKILY